MSLAMAWIARQRDVNAIIATAAQLHMHANHDQFSTKLGSTKNKEAGFVVIIPPPHLRTESQDLGIGRNEKRWLGFRAVLLRMQPRLLSMKLQGIENPVKQISLGG